MRKLIYWDDKVITKKEVEHIAKLARLGLSEAEKEKYSKELSGILDYMKKLNKVNPVKSGKAGVAKQQFDRVNTENIELTTQVSGLNNIFREDKNPHEADVEKIKKMISQAPEREGNFVKTKPILEK